jgi:hypothetical protein
MMLLLILVTKKRCVYGLMFISKAQEHDRDYQQRMEEHLTFAAMRNGLL